MNVRSRLPALLASRTRRRSTSSDVREPNNGAGAPSILKLQGAAPAAPVGAGANYAALAERYKLLAEGDTDNTQAWTFCAAAANAYVTKTHADADAYARRVAQQLKLIATNPNVSPCRDVITAEMWSGAAQGRCHGDRGGGVDQGELNARIVAHGVMPLTPIEGQPPYAAAEATRQRHLWMPGGKSIKVPNETWELLTREMGVTNVSPAPMLILGYAIRFAVPKGTRGSVEIACTHYGPEGDVLGTTQHAGQRGDRQHRAHRTRATISGDLSISRQSCGRAQQASPSVSAPSQASPV